MIFYSRANKTHFHKNGFALSLIMEVRFFWNSEVSCVSFHFLLRVCNGQSLLNKLTSIDISSSDLTIGQILPLRIEKRLLELYNRAINKKDI